MASTEILREARSRVGGRAIDDRIVRLSISNVSAESYGALDIAAIRRLGTAALHFELKVDRIDTEGKAQTGDTQIGLLADEFRKYVSSLECSDQKKSRLLELGIPYISREGGE